MAEKVTIGNCELSVKTGRTRALRLFPVIGPCRICGYPKAERHHKDGNTLNNDPSNIDPLCRKCHMKEDGRMEAVVSMCQHQHRSAVSAAAAEKNARTHCKPGHLLSGENLFINSGGSRGCKECRRIHKHDYRTRISS